MKLAVAILLVTASADAAVLQVGPDKQFSRMCWAVAAAQDGDTIEIDGGNTYLNDSCYIYGNHLTLRGVGPTRPIFRSTYQDYLAGGKATIVFAGIDLTVENIEFDGPGLSDSSLNAIRL
jgi:hypothetical protein